MLTMADIFLGYARENKQRAEQVAKALTKKGWSMWWDVKITPGSAWRKKIDEELLSARCVVVLRSRAAIESGYVIEEAQDGEGQTDPGPWTNRGRAPPLRLQETSSSESDRMGR